MPVPGARVRRTLQALVSGCAVVGVYAAAVVAGYLVLLVLLVLALAPMGGCQPFPDADECPGPPAADPLSGWLEALSTPRTGAVILGAVVLITAATMWTAVAVVEVLVWKGRHGWWWRSLAISAPAIASLCGVAAVLLHGGGHARSPGPSVMTAVIIALVGAAATAAAAVLMPSRMAPARPRMERKLGR